MSQHSAPQPQPFGRTLRCLAPIAATTVAVPAICRDGLNLHELLLVDVGAPFIPPQLAGRHRQEQTA
ncbi:hypothetical protein D5S17_34800 [Pseudonocardiaceae bacterium YIM PH 21723]|nr:hypothetical protein D5S17_34800 [Pseudonocardiaceae bacterium YIM PH 21723]